jgi:hypothetical protein
MLDHGTMLLGISSPDDRYFIFMAAIEQISDRPDIWEIGNFEVPDVSAFIFRL